MAYRQESRRVETRKRSRKPKRSDAPARRPEPVGVFRQFKPAEEAPVQRLERSRKRAVGKRVEAERQLPREHRLPLFPKKKRYSPDERAAILRETTRVLDRIAEEDGVEEHEVASRVYDRAKRQGDTGTIQTLRQFKAAWAKGRAQGARGRPRPCVRGPAAGEPDSEPFAAEAG